MNLLSESPLRAFATVPGKHGLPKLVVSMEFVVRDARSPGFLYERYRSGGLCDSDRYAERAGIEQSVHDSDTHMSSVEEEAVFIEA